jgi:large subunit ribosomal protein L6
MSLIGKQPISIPQGVTVSIEGKEVVVKGPKGQLTVPILNGISAKVEGDQLVIEQIKKSLQTNAFHGLMRSLLANHVVGVTSGFSKTLKLIGTGYRVQAKGAGISLAVGYSHQVEVMPEQGVTLKVEGNDTVVITGIDKQAVGQMAANIRKIKPPEPYKGKGIRYEGEFVKIKPGKTAA